MGLPQFVAFFRQVNQLQVAPVLGVLALINYHASVQRAAFRLFLIMCAGQRCLEISEPHSIWNRGKSSVWFIAILQCIHRRDGHLQKTYDVRYIYILYLYIYISFIFYRSGNSLHVQGMADYILVFHPILILWRPIASCYILWHPITSCYILWPSIATKLPSVWVNIAAWAPRFWSLTVPPYR